MKPPVRRANRVCLLPWKERGAVDLIIEGPTDQTSLFETDTWPRSKSTHAERKTEIRHVAKETSVRPAAWGDYSTKSVKSQIFSVNNGDLNLSLSDGSVRNCEDEQVGRRWTGHVFTTRMTLLRCHHYVGESIELVGGKFLNRPVYYLHYMSFTAWRTLQIQNSHLHHHQS